MSDSQTVTIPAAQHAAPAETRPARLLRALAQNPEPLSAPALAGLLAEPGQAPGTAVRLRQGSAPARASRPRRTGRPASVKDAAGPPSSGASPPQAAAGSTTTTTHQPSPRPPPPKHGARPPNGTRHWTKPAQPSTFRLRGSAANAPLTSSENSAAPSTRSARSSTSPRRGSARTSSGTRRHANPRESPSRARASAPANATPPGSVNIGVRLKLWTL